MKQTTESIAIDCGTAKQLKALAEQQGLSLPELLKSLSPYLPLLCALNDAGEREYREFMKDYGALIGAEDSFLSTMSYLDFTGESAPQQPGTEELLRAILGLAYANAIPAGDKEAKDQSGDIVAAVSAVR